MPVAVSGRHAAASVSIPVLLPSGLGLFVARDLGAAPATRESSWWFYGKCDSAAGCVVSSGPQAVRLRGSKKTQIWNSLHTVERRLAFYSEFRQLGTVAWVGNSPGSRARISDA